MRNSKPVLSAEEIEAKMRAELDGQPLEWIDDEVKAKREALEAQEAAAQEAYDKNPPARAYTPPPEN